MSKYTKIGIVGGVVLLLILVMYWASSVNSDDYVTDSWTLTYEPEDKGPYGTYMMKELLDTTGFFGNFIEIDKPLEETLVDDPALNDIYFFVGRRNFLKDSAVTYLMNFVSEGNTAFIAAETFPWDLLKNYFENRTAVLNKEVKDSTQYFKFYHQNLSSKRYQFDYIFENRLIEVDWAYFNYEGLLYDIRDSIESLGGNTKDEINFLKIICESGTIYLHSNPYVFTNVSMMKRDGFQYVENVLKHIPPGRMQWDKFYTEYHSENKDREKGGEKRQSMLQFIMENPPLYWAMLILLIGAILYALFKGKRQQDVIPAAESKENMSLQYINSLSSLYLQEKKHNKLVKLKERTFLNFIANHYFIISNQPDEKFIEKLSFKSHISKEEITDIFSTFDALENASSVTDQELINLHQKIENFYKNCR